MLEPGIGVGVLRDQPCRRSSLVAHEIRGRPTVLIDDLDETRCPFSILPGLPVGLADLGPLLLVRSCHLHQLISDVFEPDGVSLTIGR